METKASSKRRRQWLSLTLAGAALCCRPNPASSPPPVSTAAPTAVTAPSGSASVTPSPAAPAMSPASPVPLDSELFAAAQAERAEVMKDLEELVNMDSGTGDAGGLA